MKQRRHLYPLVIIVSKNYDNYFLSNDFRLKTLNLQRDEQLKLVEDFRPTQGMSVTVTLRIKDSHVSANFHPNVTLWKVVENLVAAVTLRIPLSTPILIRKGVEYIGREDLMQVTPNSLGYTSGYLYFRFLVIENTVLSKRTGGLLGSSESLQFELTKNLDDSGSFIQRVVSNLKATEEESPVITFYPGIARRSSSVFEEINYVLHSACKAFKIKPEEHELRYAARKLDMNMNLMFSDLPDGISLDLCPITETHEKTELVAVNLVIGDGTVNSGTFRKSATLWDISQSLIPKHKFLEEDRICMSCLSKCFEGPALLKKVPISSLKIDEGPLNLSLSRKYSAEKLNVENDKVSVSRNRKTIVVTQNSANSNKNDPNKAGTSRASASPKVSITTLEYEISQDPLNEIKKRGTNVLKQNVKRNSPYKPTRLLGSTVRLTDKRNVNTIIGKKVTSNLTAKADIDKNFYLTPEKKLKDLKYLNSRQGIAYINKQLAEEISKDDSAVDLLDLGRDSTRSFDGNIEIKLFLPDETAVQAIFRCDETVGDVFQFLNPLLQCQPSDYFLYVSNPTESVEKNITLNELEDSNGVNLYLSLNPKVKKIWPKCKPFLKEENLPKKNKL
ncbi:uncharacterized protein [Halyomorpha halys]|uniref:uncharacterized protein isoform X3 n=1 Tax=Halyomorpha halys TaxID=286706 RepID=UPI0034D20AE2